MRCVYTSDKIIEIKTKMRVLSLEMIWMIKLALKFIHVHEFVEMRCIISVKAMKREITEMVTTR